MSKANRLAGIDLCRGLAAFAVILVHSGDETWGLDISSKAIHFRHLFYYAVPFFLAAFFFFSTKKTPFEINGLFWRKKMQRIVIPYLLWSLFYVIVKSLIFVLTNDTTQIKQLLADPVAIIFLGAASYHLYFIPLLLAGSILLYLANHLLRQQNSNYLLVILSVTSIILYQLLLVSQNDFNLSSYTAFPYLLNLFSANSISYQLSRIALVNIAWIIRCLPYLFMALLTHKLLRLPKQKWLYEQETIVAIFLLFLLIDVVGGEYLPGALKEIIIAYSFLLFGIAISQYISENSLIGNLGLCSFGIYLIHPLVKSVLEIILSKLVPQISQTVSIDSILIYSIFSFLISWFCISLMHKNKFISQYT